MKPKWLISTPIHDDELFSSWLVRAAHNTGCDPLDFTSEIWKDWRIWTIDVDRNINDDKLETLISSIGKDKRYFENSFLKPYAKKMSVKLHDKSIWQWVMPYGCRNRRHSGGIQFCPHCIGVDKDPYFRVNWRFAWQTCCERHLIQLIDRCPNCKLVPQPHRVEVIDGNSSICFNCKFKYSKSGIIQCNENALLLQRECAKTLYSGFSNKFNIKSLDWFQILRLFTALINKSTNSVSDNLSKFFFTYGIDIKNLRPSKTGLTLEMLPIQERVLLLSNSWKIFNHGLENLKQKLSKHSITIKTLSGLSEPVPGKILDLFNIDEMPNKRKRKKPKKNAFQAKSRADVLRMYAKLKRSFLEIDNRNHNG